MLQPTKDGHVVHQRPKIVCPLVTFDEATSTEEENEDTVVIVLVITILIAAMHKEVLPLMHGVDTRISRRHREEYYPRNHHPYRHQQERKWIPLQAANGLRKN